MFEDVVNNLISLLADLPMKYAKGGKIPNWAIVETHSRLAMTIVDNNIKEPIRLMKLWHMNVGIVK